MTNFKHDLAVISLNELNFLGVKKGEWDDVDAIAFYIEFCKRIHYPRSPINILYSRNLPREIKQLSTAEKAAFDDIVSAFNEGRNLKNYMGTHLMATSPNKGDLLAKHTGIHHLHLEQRGKNNKFPGLTDKLLFYIEHKNTAYFITIKHHPKGSKWFDRSLLEIAYNNWEGLFQYFPMNSNVKNLSDDDIFKIMKSHINILLPYHDGFILSPGLGENICGRSVEACLQVTRYLQMLSEWKNNLIAMESNLRMKTIEATGVQLPSPIEYTLSMKDGFFTAVDTSRTLEVLLFKASDVGPEFTHLQAPENQ